MFGAHLRGLSIRQYDEKTTVERPDWAAMGFLYATPALVGGLSYFAEWRISAVDPLLGASALLVGGLLAALAQIASWRDKLTVRQDQNDRADAPRRDSLDECVAHVLMLLYASSVLVVLLAVSANVASDAECLPVAQSALCQPIPSGTVPLGLSVAVVACGSYALLLVLLVVPKLWDTYVDANNVPPHMGGTE